VFRENRNYLALPISNQERVLKMSVRTIVKLNEDGLPAWKISSTDTEVRVASVRPKVFVDMLFEPFRDRPRSHRAFLQRLTY
jgi:hypothetical protein